MNLYTIVADAARDVPRSPRQIGAGLRGWGRNVFDGSWFMLAWKTQAVASGIVRLLAIQFASWFAIPIMLPWALVATHVYESARRRGLADQIELGSNSPSGVAIHGVSWFTFGVRAHSYMRLYQFCQDKRPLRWLLLGVGIPTFGVVMGHSLIKYLSISDRAKYRFNMLARVTNVSFEVAEIKLFLFLGGSLWWLFLVGLPLLIAGSLAKKGMSTWQKRQRV